ncbi:MAG: hypothetical protein RSE41_01065 [Clostridia bacterium]
MIQTKILFVENKKGKNSTYFLLDATNQLNDFLSNIPDDKIRDIKTIYNTTTDVPASVLYIVHFSTDIQFKYNLDDKPKFKSEDVYDLIHEAKQNKFKYAKVPKLNDTQIKHLRSIDFTVLTSDKNYDLVSW